MPHPKKSLPETAELVKSITQESVRVQEVCVGLLKAAEQQERAILAAQRRLLYALNDIIKVLEDKP